MNLTTKSKNLIFISIMAIITTVIYLNHFDNAFHFDDFHAINENPNIRSLDNIPLFFLDGTTSSSLPQNQSYRPILSTSLAIDYWLGNGYDLFYFHFITFLVFLLQGVLVFFFTHKILELSVDNKYNFYIASGITLWYMIHPVMAETVNYIISRSDLQSTFFVVLAFVLYQYWTLGKKYHLYLIPIIIGALAKPTAIMFAPLFFCYVLIFEHNMSFVELFSKKMIPKSTKAVKQITPALLVCTLLYIFINVMTPDTYTTGSSRVYNYLISQPYVIAYYFGSSILPIHLSADTDWVVLESIWSYKFLIGFLIILTLMSIAFICSKKKKYYPIAFGITWFFIALAPTSSFLPLSEVMNDHRMFFPYVGLIISLGYSVALIFPYLKKEYHLKNTHLIGSISALLLLYAFGTYNRNKVWHSEESLWKDVTIKSPKNGRGLMNYGLTQMAKGKYDIAKIQFERALKLTPNYHTLHVNLGILNNALGNIEDAEKYFKQATQYGFNYYGPWFYYGRFLTKNSRSHDAIKKLKKSMELSRYHMETKYLLMENYLNLEDWDNLREIANQTLKIENNNKKAQVFLNASIEKKSKLQVEENKIKNNPTTQKYLNLSLKYYHKKQYQKCIEAAKKALEIDPNYPEAYNNICSAYNSLGNYDKALLACNKAIKIKPDFNLAKNNLNDVVARKTKTKNLINLVTNDPTESNYLNLSLLYYNYGLFEKCAAIAEVGVMKHPNSDNLYNNICAAYNSIQMWDKALKYGRKGLTINPKNQLLRNNYNLALKNTTN